MTSLTAAQKKSFEDQGFIIVKSPEWLKLREELFKDLKTIALSVLRRDAELGPQANKLAGESFERIFQFIIQNEKDNRISSRLYEVFLACHQMIRLITEPVFVDLAKALGVAFPVPSTLPVVRIDRPGEEKYLTPPHQDYWYSMLSLNSITMWLPFLPVPKEMGHLQVIPGTHRLGLLETKPFTKENPFTTARTFADSEYIEADVAVGELLVFYQLLVHRSAPNRSKDARFTLQLRYNDLETMAVPTSSFTPKYSKYTADAQQKNLGGGAERPAAAPEGAKRG